MSQILTDSEIDREQWSALVQTSATGTWFQTPEAYDFFAANSAEMEAFVVGVAVSQVRPASAVSSEILRGVCCGYVTVEKNPIKQFFTRRAIIIGGPCLADDATDEEVEALMKAVASPPSPLPQRGEEKPIYIETRNFNDYSRWKVAFEKAGFSYQPHLNFHVDCADKKRMWERLSDNRKRQLRKPTLPKDQSIENTEADITEWYGILRSLYRTKVKTPLFPLSFFLEANKQKIGTFLLIRHNGRVIGGSMLVHDEKSVYEWFECGLNKEYKDQYPSVFATYAGMQYAYEQGIPRYDMMGAGVPEVPYGVRDFKSEFGGELVEHGRWLFVAKPLLYRIGALGVKLLKKGSVR